MTQGRRASPVGSGWLIGNSTSASRSRHLKRGDRYLRMLLTRRPFGNGPPARRDNGRPLDGLRAWALAVQGPTTTKPPALANKLADLCLTLRDAP